MKKFAFLMIMALTAVMTMPLSAYGKETPEGQRTVLKTAREFNSIVLNAPVTVELIEDAQHPGFVVYHSTASESELKVYNEGSKLVIGVNKKFRNKHLHVTSRLVVCYASEVNDLTVNGSGSILSKRIDSKSAVKCTINGSGDIKIGNLYAAGKFEGTVNGSGDLDLESVSSASMQASVNGSGDFTAKKCVITDCADLSVNGSGDVDVDEIKAADVKASVNGSGDIDLKGTAVNATLTIRGSGDLNAGSLKAENVTVAGTGSGDIYCRATRSLSGNVGKSCDIHVRGKRPAQVSIVSDNVHYSDK